MNPMMKLNVIAFIVAITHSYEVHDVRSSISGGNSGVSTKSGSSKSSPNNNDVTKRRVSFPYTKLLASRSIYQPYVFPIEKLRPPSLKPVPDLKPIRKPSPTKKNLLDSSKYDEIYAKIEKKMGENFGLKLEGRKGSAGDGTFVKQREKLLDVNSSFKDVLLKAV